MAGAPRRAEAARCRGRARSRSASAPRDRDRRAAVADALARRGRRRRARRPGACSKRVPLQLDALIDAIVPLTLEAPVSGEVVLAAPAVDAPRRQQAVPASKGLNAETGEWEPPAAGQRYGELQAGVQLASRTGALNEIEYSEFVQTHAGVRRGDRRDDRLARHARRDGARARARRLRQPARRAARGAPARARRGLERRLHPAACARHGFVPGVVPGRLVLPVGEEGAPPVLTLTFDSQAALADEPDRAAVRDVTLRFDVPQTPEAVEPFAAWQAAARRRSPSAWTRRSSTTQGPRHAACASARSGRSSGSSTRARGARPRRRVGRGAAPVQLTAAVARASRR